MKLLFYLLFPVFCQAQLTSLVVRNDTVFNFNPSTGEYTQLTKHAPAMLGQSGKILGTNGTNYVWITPEAGAATFLSLNTITQIVSQISPTIQTILVTDSVRGGTFILYTGTDAADNGMIFLDGLGNKWKRVVNNNVLEATWYGASTAASGATNLAALNAARDYVYTHRASFKELHLNGNVTQTYALSSTLLFNQSIVFTGDGVLWRPATNLSFPHNTRGIYFQAYNSTLESTMKNISVANIASANQYVGLRSGLLPIPEPLSCANFAE